jgi:hypothetical protein
MALDDRLPGPRRRRDAWLVVGALLALAVFGKLAYVGALRLLARADGLAVDGHRAIDITSVVVGSAACVAALDVLRAVIRRIAPLARRS